MRNFIIAFMILVLFSSIMLVVLRPFKHSPKRIEKTEKTHVEKLLTEPAKYEKHQEKDITSYEEPYTTLTDIMTEQEESSSPQQEETEANSQQFNEKKEQRKISAEPKQYDKNYQQISKELMEKYGNNPNAQVTDEDLQHFMIKILDMTQMQQ